MIVPTRAHGVREFTSQHVSRSIIAAMAPGKNRLCLTVR
jgi:hypothetical protein